MNEKTDWTKFSFIIISGGERIDSLNRLLNSIRNQKILNYEIIVVGKLPGITSVPVEFIERHNWAESGAICKMRNTGIDYSTGNLLIFLDDDVELTGSWFKKLYPHLDATFDIAGSKILSPDGNRWYDWCWASRNDSACPSRLLEYSDHSENLYISGCCLIVRRSVFNILRFNEHLLNHQRDDVDFCHRAIDAGMKFLCFPDTVVIHHLEPFGRSKNDPGSGTDQFAEGVHCFRSGKYKQAMDLFHKCEKKDVKLLYHMGLTLKQMGKIKKSGDYFRDILKNVVLPDDAEEKRLYYSAAFHLGQLAETEGNKTEAACYYKLAVHGLPEHFQARERFETLYTVQKDRSQ